MTAVDWPDREKTDKVKTKQMVDWVQKEIEQTIKTRIPGYLEVVYHLFSMTKHLGPVVDPYAHRQSRPSDDVTAAHR